MDLRLLAAATIAAFGFAVTPANALPANTTMFPQARAPQFSSVPPSGFDACRTGDRHHRHRDGGFACGAFGGWVYADGNWARYNNRSWDSDSFNDWWHDRPDRAFPRWVQEQRAQGTCDPDRMWWSGSGWHC
ncbi:MAG: hypothetical protein ACM3ZV_03680 [Bacillota bacterium]